MSTRTDRSTTGDRSAQRGRPGRGVEPGGGRGGGRGRLGDALAGDALVGTLSLVRLALRRDRWRLPLWVGGTTAVTAVSAAAVADLYRTPEQIASYAATVSSSGATRLINGQPVALDTIGGITAYEVTATASIAVALMAASTVVRHSRAEEESGRAELLRATVTGRHAAILAAVLVATTASLLIGLLDTVVLLAAGLPTSGSVLHGAALAATGLLFTGVAAVTAQVTSSARAAFGAAGALVGVGFVVRGVGDVTETGVRWASPFGWQQAVNAYGDERVWPVVLLLVAAAAALAAAAFLLARRDAGAGLRHPRPARPRARPLLGTPVGLAWRLQRGLVLGWASGLVAMAAIFGSVGDEVTTMVEENPELGEVFAEMGSGTIVDAFFAFTAAFLAVVVGFFTVASVLRLRAEEEAARAELVLASAVGRVRWAVGGLVVSVVGTLALLVLVGLGLGLGYALTSGDETAVLGLLGATLAQAPGALVLVGVSLLLWGWSSRVAPLAWAVAGFAFLESYLGTLLDLPDAVAGISPYWWLPALPVEDAEPVTSAVLLAVAAGAAVVGLVGLRRRDLG